MEQLVFPSTVARLVREAIELLRENEPPEGYHGCFSGGKDSIVIKELARMSGVKVVWHYNVTTIDPPELIYFIKEHHKDVIWDRPKHGNFFRRAAEKKGFPTRRARWCCEEYKEGSSPKGAVLILGIRAEESVKRAKSWEPVKIHFRTGAPTVQPILYWASDELWQFIRGQGLPYCKLYDEGFHRLGCVGCPMAGRAGRLKEFKRWPRYEKRWKYVFKRVYERRTGSLQRDGREWFGDAFFSWVDPGRRSGSLEWRPEGAWQRMYSWWLSDASLKDRKYLILEGS